MPTGAFIQDETTASSSSSSNLMRVNLLSAQPLGAASLQTSSLQVFLDRRLDQDDNRGMEQAMNDNIVTSNKFLILFESLNNAPSRDYANSNNVNKVSDMPSLTSQLYSYDLLNPLVKLITSNRNVKDSVELLSGKRVFPCDLRLINMRTMQKEVKTGGGGGEGEDESPMSNEVGLILHRIPYEDCPSAPFVQLSSTLLSECNNDNYNQFSFGDLFGFLSEEVKIKTIENTLLTLHTPKVLRDDEEPVTNGEFILNHVQPMQVEAFRVKF
jgi:alpha-mannosidase II